MWDPRVFCDYDSVSTGKPKRRTPSVEKCLSLASHGERRHLARVIVRVDLKKPIDLVVGHGRVKPRTKFLLGIKLQYRKGCMIYLLYR